MSRPEQARLRVASTGGYVCVDDTGEPSTGNPRVSIASDEARILSELFLGLAVLEIGTGLGISTRAIASTASLVVTLDVDPWVERNVAFSEYNIIQLDRRDLRRLELKYQAAFIDAAHDTSSVIADVALAVSVVTQMPRLIVLHDYAHERVRAGGAGYPFELMKTTYGLGIVRLPAVEGA